MKTSHIFSILGIAFLASCKPNLKSDIPSANGLDLSRYVAIGNSLTAGYADLSLYKDGQLNSYPAILAGQFKAVGGGAFVQPLLKGEKGYPGPKMILGPVTDCMGVTSLGPKFLGSTDTSGEGHPTVPGPYNNLGVPGIRVIDYLQHGYAMFNPYAARFYEDPMESPIDQAMKIDPTFFTMWLGSMDILGYATTGGEEHANPMHPDNISDPAMFKAAYDSIMRVMTRSGAKGVVMNIPDIASIPLFTTIPANGLVLDAAQAGQLSGLYAGTGISFAAGPNNFIIEDQSVPVIKMRKIAAGEYILLSIPQDSMKCGGWGSARPIPKKYVLTADEVAKINAATTEFNNFIKAEAIKYHVAFADMNSFQRTLSSGIKYNGVDYSSQFINGGLFSLDGTHPTPRGYALIANELIRVINSYYGTAIPVVDANSYGGIKIP